MLKMFSEKNAILVNIIVNYVLVKSDPRLAFCAAYDDPMDFGANVGMNLYPNNTFMLNYLYHAKNGQKNIYHADILCVEGIFSVTLRKDNVFRFFAVHLKELSIDKEINQLHEIFIKANWEKDFLARQSKNLMSQIVNAIEMLVSNEDDKLVDFVHLINAIIKAEIDCFQKQFENHLVPRLT